MQNTQELIDLIKVAKGGNAEAAKVAWLAIANYHQALTDAEVEAQGEKGLALITPPLKPYTPTYLIE